jgi:hypothetical protein
MALTTPTNVGFPTNIPGTLRKSTGNPFADGVFVYADGADKWERVFDSGQKTYYASWLKTSAAPSDLTALINIALADARVKIFVVDADITINSTVSAGGKVVEFVSGIVSGVGSIDGADIRARWSYSYLGGSVTLTNCVFSSYTPRLASDAEANGKNIIYYYNTTTSKHRFKNGATWYDVITSIAQVTADSLQGDGSVGAPIKLDNDNDAPGANKLYGTNPSGVKGWIDIPTANNLVTTGDSLQGDGSGGSPIKLDNDTAAPGNNQVYGTDGAGAKGWKSSLQTTADSLQGDGTAGNPIKLDNDSNAPGNNKVYRTDGSGVKGWSDFPAASGTINTTNSVTGDGSVGTPAKLVGDAATPGNWKLYGTNASGTKGFYTLTPPEITQASAVTNGVKVIQNVLGSETFVDIGGGVTSWLNTAHSPSFVFRFENNTTMAFPAAGKFRLNNVVPESATEICFNSQTFYTNFVKEYFDEMTVGTYIVLHPINHSQDGGLVFKTTSGNLADLSGYGRFTVTLVSETVRGALDADEPVGFTFDIQNSALLSTVTTADSLQGNGTGGSPVKLDNDNNTPGNNKVYGTDGSGVKGWRDFPATGATINTTNSITGDGSGGTPAKLVGDVVSPGNNKVYGTDGSGNRTWRDFPSGSATITTADSITGDGSGGTPAKLVGDSAAPGASRYYGTNGGGTKGYHALPTVDGSETKVQAGTNTSVTGTGTTGSPYTINSTMVTGTSLTGNGTSGTPATLVNDSASPGNNRLYGTNGSGVKGWYAQPSYDGSETKVNAGSNVTVTGSGTVGSPYVINATTASPIHASKDSLTAAVGLSFCMVKSTGGTFESADKVLKLGHPTNDDQRNITLQAMLHIEASSFTLGQFNHVATIPAGFRPTGIVNFPIAPIVPGTGNTSTTPIRSSGSVGILNGGVYGTCAGYIDPDNGFVYARINSVSSYPTLSGVATTVIPLVVTYFINVNT